MYAFARANSHESHLIRRELKKLQEYILTSSEVYILMVALGFEPRAANCGM